VRQYGFDKIQKFEPLGVINNPTKWKDNGFCSN